MTIIDILAMCERPDQSKTPEGYTMKDMAEATRKHGGIASIWGKQVIVTPLITPPSASQVAAFNKSPRRFGLTNTIQTGPTIDLNDIKNRRFGKQ